MIKIMIAVVFLIIDFIILIILSLMSASLFTKFTDLSFWWGAIFLAFLGIALYVIHLFLMISYLNKNAPGVLDLDAIRGKQMQDGKYLWEKTAAKGIVPKWVSLIGMSPYACFIGIIIWLITWL